MTTSIRIEVVIALAANLLIRVSCQHHHFALVKEVRRRYNKQADNKIGGYTEKDRSEHATGIEEGAAHAKISAALIRAN
jgi:hypothetical protein